MMNNRWDFNLFKAIILFCTGIVFGGNIELYITGNISTIGALLGTISMLLLAIFIMVSSWKKETKE